MKTVTIVDWREDFIAALGSFTASMDPARTLILLPHNRPARHLTQWYRTAELPLPRMLPDMASFDTFVTGLRKKLSPAPLHQATKLDRIALTMDIVRELAAEGTGLLARLDMEPARFFPWGMRLASLLEEFLRQTVTPRNLAHMSTEVAPWGAALLEQLGTISEAYLHTLEERGWTTPGLDHRFLAGHPDRVSEALGETRVVAAGFYALSGTEDALFKHLWDRDQLDILWHTDPDLARDKPGAPEVVEHRNWLRSWNVKADLFSPAPTQSTPHAPEVDFVEAFDLHSQLRGLTPMLERDLATGTLAGTAVVLPETGSLLPLLHQLPGGEDLPFNISMGYPLEQTSLYQLVDTLLRLQENGDGKGNYAWRDLLELLRHPYLKMLAPEPERATSDLRRIFHAHAASVRTGEKYQDPHGWLPPYGHGSLAEVTGDDSQERFRRTVLATCLDGFTGLDTLAGLARALSELVRLLREHGAHLWPRYVIDAEYLARLATSIIPQLTTSAMSHEQLGQGAVFAVLRSLCRAERVSFEPEPLAGMQIMGVLETRLLSFKRLYVLDAVEDKLPSSSPYDPLLPDPLRHSVGLPDSRERDNVSAYNFKRLLMGAEHVTLIYQAGVQPGLFDSKSVRSRYVEELIWQREKEERRGKKLMEPGEPPIGLVHFPAAPIPAPDGDIPMDDALRELLYTNVTTKGLAATSLDCWLTCPKKFFYRYLARLSQADEVQEGGNPAAFGDIMHQVLKEFLTPHMGREHDLSLLDSGQLVRDFRAAFQGDERMNQLAWDVRLALLSSAELRLTRFIRNQGHTRILALEREYTTGLGVRLANMPDLTIPLKGDLDRVDEREMNGEHGVLILDYKTGSVHMPAKGVWDDMDLWTRIEAREQGDMEDAELLPDLKKALRSVQLPLYLHLYGEGTGTTAHDAGLVELGRDGKEHLLFGPKWSKEEREETCQVLIPRLLRALMADMLCSDAFRAIPGAQCLWCDYHGPCGR